MLYLMDSLVAQKNLLLETIFISLYSIAQLKCYTYCGTFLSFSQKRQVQKGFFFKTFKIFYYKISLYLNQSHAWVKLYLIQTQKPHLKLTCNPTRTHQFPRLATWHINFQQLTTCKFQLVLGPNLKYFNPQFNSNLQ